MSTLKVNTIQDTTGNDALTIDSSGNVTASQGFIPSTQLSHRNIIINGGFKVSQRGDYTSATSISAGNYYLDRWTSFVSVVTGTIQQTDVTINGVSKKAQKITATSSGTGYIGTRQMLELTNIPVGETLVASCWVRSNNSNTRFRTNAFRGSSTNTDSPAFTNDGNWEKVSWTIETTGTVTNPSLWVITYDGAAVSVTSGDYIEITEVQLEVGSVATPFEHRSYGEELARCQRYYQKTKSAFGIGYGSGVGINFIYTFTVPMRNSPTVSSEGVIQVSDWVTTDYTQSSTSISINGGTNVTTEGIAVSCTNFSGLTNNRPYAQKPNSTNAITFDAEL